MPVRSALPSTLKALLILVYPMVAADLATFSKFGDGDCLGPDFAAVQGRSTTDVSHGQCRAACSTTACLGYSYAPCARICTVHGDPGILSAASSGPSWLVVSGDSSIKTSTRQCGSGCYVRLPSCPAGSLVSGGVTMNYGALVYGSNATLSCPFPYSGNVRIQCGVYGLQLLSGMCEQPCPPSTVTDGSFLANYSQVLSRQYAIAACPAGVGGSVQIYCFNGQIQKLGGRCGYSCPAGSLKAGTAFIQWNLIHHEAYINVTCPAGYLGTVTLYCQNTQVQLKSGTCVQDCAAQVLQMPMGSQIAAANTQQMHSGQSQTATCGPSNKFRGTIVAECMDGTVSLAPSGGICRRHCLSGKVVSGSQSVSYSVIYDNTSVVLQCPPAYHGSLLVACEDGTATVLSGVCDADCLAGTISSNAVVLPHEFMVHGTNVTLDCPSGYTGAVVALCLDGHVSGVDDFCGKDCPASQITSNSALIVYETLSSGTRKNISCPAPWGDSLLLECFQGRVRLSGVCKNPCQGGRLVDSSAVVIYEAMDSSEVAEFRCQALRAGTLRFSSTVTLTCYDGQVTQQGLCYPDCNSGTLRNNGATVNFDFLRSGASLVATCSPDDTFGVVTVTCIQGYAKVTQGSCGSPCPAQRYVAAITRYQPLSLPLLAHRQVSWEYCPAALSNRILFSCFNGQLTTLAGGCGLRCQSVSTIVYGASFVSPLMIHNTSYTQPCTFPFTGDISIRCWDGYLNVTSHCQNGCMANTTVLSNGAAVSYKDMKSGDTYSATCPLNYLGPIVLECVNGGIQVASGLCAAPCSRGRFTAGSGFQIDFPDMTSNQTQVFTCPSGYSGQVTLRCTNSAVALDTGTCTRNCDAGVVNIRMLPDGSSMTMPNAAMLNGVASASTLCPTGFSGSVEWTCKDGLVAVTQGMCYLNCPAGEVLGAPYQLLLHGQTGKLQCPEAGTVTVNCNDGTVSLVSGQCFYNCLAGTVNDTRGVPVQYPAMNYMTNATGTCYGLGIGSVLVRCNNSVVAVLPGQRCQRHCLAQTVTTPDGIHVSAPRIGHNQLGYTSCPANQIGRITLHCFDGISSVVDGDCGPFNCAAGQVLSGQSLLTYPEINNHREVGPQACPQPQIGAGTIFCKNGTTEVLDITVVMPPTLVGQSDADYVNETVENTFVLCECCTLPEPAPPPAVVQGLNRVLIIYWALGAAGAVVFVALASGFWLLRIRTPTKPSRVLPEEENPDKLALEDDENAEERSESLWQPDGQPTSPTLALKDAEKDSGHLALASTAAMPREPLALALQDGSYSSLALVQLKLPQNGPASLQAHSQSKAAVHQSPSNLQHSQQLPLSKKDQVKMLVQSTRRMGNNTEWKNW